jgi:hypothetical protein
MVNPFTKPIDNMTPSEQEEFQAAGVLAGIVLLVVSAILFKVYTLYVPF